MQKEVFQTDNDGLYLYKSVANELPLASNEFNIAYGAYENAPPEPPAGKWPRRVADAWVMVEDHRTTPLWAVDTGAPYSIGVEHDGVGGKACYPGWGTLPGWLTAVKPPSAEGTEDNA